MLKTSVKNLSALILLIVVVAACDKTSNYETTADGLKYKIHTDKEGEKVKEGEVLSLLFQMKTSKDSVINSYNDPENPFVIPARKPPFKGSIEEGLFLLSKGDSATFLVSSDSIFKGTPLPPFIEKGSDIAFEVKVLDIQTPEVYQKAQMENFKNEQLKAEVEVKRHVTLDDSLIRNYLNEKNIKATKTASGLYYVIDKPGKGAKVEKGDSVQVAYRGYLLSGEEFDSSVGKPPFTFPIGVGAVIPGWDEGLMLLSEGAKARFFIPSGLAYKNQGQGPIKPYSVLLFDVELLNVKKTK